jgi:hypothetical protein
MKRKARYLVASILSLAKPFLAGAIIVGINMAEPGSLGSFFLRYLILTQLIPAVCLFFLYFDEETYHVFKPLVLLFAGVSSLLIVLCAVPIAQNPQKYLLTAQNLGGLIRVSASIVLLCGVDLFDFITILVSMRKKPVLPANSRSDRLLPVEGMEGAGIAGKVEREEKNDRGSARDDKSSQESLSSRSDHVSNA